MTAKTYQANTETLNPIPDYLKEFTSMFSKMSFDILPEPKEWDHAVELIPESKTSGCKVFPLSPVRTERTQCLLERKSQYRQDLAFKVVRATCKLRGDRTLERVDSL